MDLHLDAGFEGCLICGGQEESLTPIECDMFFLSFAGTGVVVSAPASGPGTALILYPLIFPDLVMQIGLSCAFSLSTVLSTSPSSSISPIPFCPRPPETKQTAGSQEETELFIEQAAVATNWKDGWLPWGETEPGKGGWGEFGL